MTEKNYQYTRNISLGLLALAIFAIISLFSRIHEIYTIKQLQQNGEVTQGKITQRLSKKVTSLKHGVSKTSYIETAEYSYEVQGKEYRTKSSVFNDYYQISYTDDILTLTYLKNNPETCRVGDIRNYKAYTGWDIFSIILLTLLMLPVVFYEIRLQKERKN